MIRRTSIQLSLFVVCFASGLCVHGQEKIESVVKSDLEVVRTEWKYAGYSRIEVVNNSRIGGEFKVARKNAYGFKYEASAVFKNTGSRTVSAFEWELFFTDKKSNKELKRFRVESKQDVPPGHMVAVSKVFFLDPSQNLQLDDAVRKAVVTKVLFAKAEK